MEALVHADVKCAGSRAIHTSVVVCPVIKALSYKSESDEVDKAYSDMQKDSALMQYTYFVGESNVITDNEDGVVLLKPSMENME